MASALTPPTLVAALVLALAAVAKFRAPAAAAQALLTLGLPGRRTVRESAVRLISLGELALAASVVLSGAEGLEVALGTLYVGFAAMTVALARRQAECGCFGDSGAPASSVGAGLNLAFAAICLLDAATGSRGAGRVLELPAWQVPVATLAIAAATVAAALVYTELPRAWRSWSGG